MKGFFQIFSFVAFALFLGSCEVGSLAGDADSEEKALDRANAPAAKNLNGHVKAVLHQYGYNNGSTIHDAYFFGKDSSGKGVYIRDRYSSETDYEQLVEGPEPVSNWDNLYLYPDAFMQLENANDNAFAYVFFEDMYILISYTYEGKANKLFRGPYSFTGKLAPWMSLKRARFSSVDAFLVYMIGGPKNSIESYVFSGDKYIKIRIEDGGLGEDTLIQNPRSITEGWRILRDAGFEKVDAILPISSPGPDWCSMYVFSKDQYLAMKVNPYTGEEQLITGPQPILSKWKNLR